MLPVLLGLAVMAGLAGWTQATTVPLGLAGGTQAGLAESMLN